MAWGQRPDEPGKWASAALAAGMHVVLAVFLIYGVRWQNRPVESLEVELVREVPAPPAPKPAPVVEQPPPPKPEPKPEPKVEPKPLPKPEPKPAPPPPKPDIALKEKEKPKPKEPPKPDPREVERKRLERQMEEERRRMQAALDRETDRLETEKLKQELEREQRELADRRTAQAAASARDKALASYVDRIRSKIRGNIVKPAELKGNPVAVFDVVQLPDGQIIDITKVKSSGNAAWDDAVERAINKSSPLPKPDPGLGQVRTLNLTFCPEEGPGCR